MLHFKNPANLRQVLLCSVLSERPVTAELINQFETPSGLKPCEERFLQLVETVSNGCKLAISKGGNQLRFQPGLVTNNEGVEFDFDCGLDRCISYYLEYLLVIAIFSKSALNVHLQGITNDEYDNSVDSIQQELLPLLKERYGFDNELQMKVLKRGYLPLGGGDVHVIIPSVKSLNKVTLLEKGYVKRIRGVCAGSKISTTFLSRTVNKTREVFNQYLPDVWVFTDYFKGDKSSVSPGYSLSLVAETNTGSLLTADATLENNDPEEVAVLATSRLLDEIKYAGVVSTHHQWFLLTLMAFSERKTSQAKLGRVSPFTIECLRILKEFFGVIFEIEESETDGMAIFSVLGLGLQNYARIVK